MGVVDVIREAFLVVEHDPTIVTLDLVINLIGLQFDIITVTVVVTNKLLSNPSVLYHCKVFITNVRDVLSPIQNINKLLCFCQ